MKEVIGIGPFSTSRGEIGEIFKAWIAVTLIFSIVLSDDIGTINAILVSLIAVGLGVVLHELAHKMVAQHFGGEAEFVSFPSWMLLGIFLSIFGIIFLAPGAVFISGPIGRRRGGMVSAAGPLTNIILALVFLLLSNIDVPLIYAISHYGVSINGWLALFNMIPLGPLDGKKVWRWNKIVFGIMIIASFIIVYKVA